MLAYDGIVRRAENKALLNYTKMKFTKLGNLSLKKFDLIALVDTQPGTGNHSLKIKDDVHIVFDHHRMRPRTHRVPFYAVHSNIGTTSTLLYQYLKAAGVEIESRLATIVGMVMMAGWFYYELAINQTIRWDLFSILMAMAITKFSAMLYYRLTN